MTLRDLAVQVDERLSDLYSARWSQQQDLMIAAERARSAAGQEREILSTDRWGRPKYGNWIGTLDEALATIDAMPEDNSRYSASAAAKRYAAETRFALAGLKQIDAEAGELNMVWIEEGRWNRAFLVINSNGHVHNGMTCSTCYESTRYEWLTAYSAADEDEIVAAAGEMACTVCYPSAPSDYLNRPANLISKTRAEKDAAAAKRAEEKAAREAKRKAKAPTASGEPLMLPSTYTVNRGRMEAIQTEATARREWNSAEEYKGWRSDPDYIAILVERQRLIVEALAVKYGVSDEEMEAQLRARYSKRKR